MKDPQDVSTQSIRKGNTTIAMSAVSHFGNQMCLESGIAVRSVKDQHTRKLIPKRRSQPNPSIKNNVSGVVLPLKQCIRIRNTAIKTVAIKPIWNCIENSGQMHMFRKRWCAKSAERSLRQSVEISTLFFAVNPVPISMNAGQSMRPNDTVCTCEV